jgi:hypothetical protein
LLQGKNQDNALKELFAEWPVPEGKSIEDLPPSDMEIQLRSFVSLDGMRFTSDGNKQ